MRFIVIIIVFILVMPAVAIAKDWEVVRTQGMVKLVLVSQVKEKDFLVYEDAVSSLCMTEKFCSVQFWSDKGKMPMGSLMDMNDSQLEARTAAYLRNSKTGYNEFFTTAE